MITPPPPSVKLNEYSLTGPPVYLLIHKHCGLETPYVDIEPGERWLME